MTSVSYSVLASGAAVVIVPAPEALPDCPTARLSDSLELDLDVHAGREVEAHQGADRLLARLQHVDQALVGAHLEVLLRVLVDEGRAHHGVALDPRRQRHGAGNLRA